MVLGDSISAASHPTAWSCQIPTVANLAAAGAPIADLPGQLRSAPPAATAVISIGTNDIIRWSDPLDLSELTDAIAVATSLFERVALLDVLTYLPWWRLHARRLTLDRQVQIRSAIAATGLSLKVELPFWCWQRDWIHPNRAGHLRIAAAVARWLTPRGRCPT